MQSGGRHSTRRMLAAQDHVEDPRKRRQMKDPNDVTQRPTSRSKGTAATTGRASNAGHVGNANTAPWEGRHDTPMTYVISTGEIRFGPPPIHMRLGAHLPPLSSVEPVTIPLSTDFVEPLRTPIDGRSSSPNIRKERLDPATGLSTRIRSERLTRGDGKLSNAGESSKRPNNRMNHATTNGESSISTWTHQSVDQDSDQSEDDEMSDRAEVEQNDDVPSELSSDTRQVDHRDPKPKFKHFSTSSILSPSPPILNDIREIRRSKRRIIRSEAEVDDDDYKDYKSKSIKKVTEQVKQKVKRTPVGRFGPQRREQNMTAQKKYRDKMKLTAKQTERDLAEMTKEMRKVSDKLEWSELVREALMAENERLNVQIEKMEGGTGSVEKR